MKSSENQVASSPLSVTAGFGSLYAAPYINEIRMNVRKMTRRELRKLMTIRHGQRIPKDANLRNYVAKFHAHQQAINGGAVPSEFWHAAVGLPNPGMSRETAAKNQNHEYAKQTQANGRTRRLVGSGPSFGGFANEAIDSRMW